MTSVSIVALLSRNRSRYQAASNDEIFFNCLARFKLLFSVEIQSVSSSISSDWWSSRKTLLGSRIEAKNQPTPTEK